MEKTSVIIVSWNVANSLAKCLQSVFAADKLAEVIVIDNASSDKSVGVVKKTKAKLILNKSNLGFPKAVNQGLQIASGDYFLILNPDARIPKDFFTSAIQFLKTHPDAGIMGPKLLNPDSTPQGSVFNTPSIFRSNQKYTPISHLPLAVTAISGACMFLPKSTITQVGFFTEEVFMYYEDLDYCRRIRKTGLKVYFNPLISVIHEHGASAKQNPKVLDWRGQLWKSSLWYNGPIKHYSMWFISLCKQKLHLRLA